MKDNFLLLSRNITVYATTNSSKTLSKLKFNELIEMKRSRDCYVIPDTGDEMFQRHG